MSGASENPDGSKKERKHGHAIEDGEWRYGSVSQCEKADASGSPETGCLRKWHFDKVNGIKEPPTEATKRGDQCHFQTATFLRTGDRSGLTQLSAQAIRSCPTPGDDLLIEHDMIPDMPDGSSGLSIAPLRAAGVPFWGAIDLIHARPENPGVQDIRDATDGPDVLKIIDHKFPRTLDHAKHGSDLVHTIQMSGYATWGFKVFPDFERIRLIHNVNPVVGQPRLATAVVDREAVARTWKRVDVLAASMRDAARERDSNKVDANPSACHAFHKPCPALQQCAARSRGTLAGIFGRTGAERIAQKLALPHTPLIPATRLLRPGAPQAMTTPNAPAPNSIKARLAAARAAQGQPGTTATTAVQTSTVAATTAPVTADAVDAEVARLEAAAAAAGAPAVPTADAAKVVTIANQLKIGGLKPAEPEPQAPSEVDLQVLADIDELGIGMPGLAGDVAKAYGAASGYPNAKGFAGSGELGQYTIRTAAELPSALEHAKQIKAKLEAEAAAKAATEAAEAAAQAQAEAQKKMAVEDQAEAEARARVVAEIEKAQAKQPNNSLLPPDASVSTVASSSKAADKAEGKNKTPKAPKPPKAAPAVTVAAVQANDAQMAATAAVIAAREVERVHVYVNCIPEGVPWTSLNTLIAKISASLTEETGAADFRVAADDRFDYGKWKGAVAGCLREAPELGLLPPGHHVLDATGEVAQAAVEPLRDIVMSLGGVFVKRVW